MKTKDLEMCQDGAKWLNTDAINTELIQAKITFTQRYDSGTTLVGFWVTSPTTQLGLVTVDMTKQRKSTSGRSWKMSTFGKSNQQRVS